MRKYVQQPARHGLGKPGRFAIARMTLQPFAHQLNGQNARRLAPGYRQRAQPVETMKGQSPAMAWRRGIENRFFPFFDQLTGKAKTILEERIGVFKALGQGVNRLVPEAVGHPAVEKLAVNPVSPPGNAQRRKCPPEECADDFGQHGELRARPPFRPAFAHKSSGGARRYWPRNAGARR